MRLVAGITSVGRLSLAQLCVHQRRGRADCHGHARDGEKPIHATLAAALPHANLPRIPLREDIRHVAPIRDEALLGTAAVKFMERPLASAPQSLVVSVNLVTDLGRGLGEVLDLDKSRVGKSLQMLAHHRVHDRYRLARRKVKCEIDERVGKELIRWLEQVSEADDITSEAQLLDRLFRSRTPQAGDDLVEIGDTQRHVEGPTLSDGSELIDLLVRDVVPLDGVIDDVVVEVDTCAPCHDVERHTPNSKAQQRQRSYGGDSSVSENPRRLRVQRPPRGIPCAPSGRRPPTEHLPDPRVQEMIPVKERRDLSPSPIVASRVSRLVRIEYRLDVETMRAGPREAPPAFAHGFNASRIASLACRSAARVPGRS